MGVYQDAVSSLQCASPTNPSQEKLNLFEGYNIHWLLGGPSWRGSGESWPSTRRS